MTLTKLTFDLNEFLPPSDCPKTFFDTNGFLDIPHFLNEFIFKATTKLNTLKALFTVIRKSYGFKKHTPLIYLDDICRLTGCERSNASKALKELVSKNIIVDIDKKGPNGKGKFYFVPIVAKILAEEADKSTTPVKAKPKARKALKTVVNSPVPVVKSPTPAIGKLTNRKENNFKIKNKKNISQASSENNLEKRPSRLVEDYAKDYLAQQILPSVKKTEREIYFQLLEANKSPADIKLAFDYLAENGDRSGEPIQKIFTYLAGGWKSNLARAKASSSGSDTNALDATSIIRACKEYSPKTPMPGYLSSLEKDWIAENGGRSQLGARFDLDKFVKGGVRRVNV